jgi:hypothetical protein
LDLTLWNVRSRTFYALANGLIIGTAIGIDVILTKLITIAQGACLK